MEFIYILLKYLSSSKIYISTEKTVKKTLCEMNEGLNFEQYNFRIADVSNLKINKRSNVEQPNLRVTKK